MDLRGAESLRLVLIHSKSFELRADWVKQWREAQMKKAWLLEMDQSEQRSVGLAFECALGFAFLRERELAWVAWKPCGQRKREGVEGCNFMLNVEFMEGKE
ncbi:hypothetical protein CK203_072600 [Vitis vinifera]|uniref:Uncharacterized protein n=1 Tax=Vitis vinifera TaxID=29760 RepID=A0A438F978_VITVI|nr:hypothetical protein CK203_072600 [Vitis vinifera]